jgi:hypothetical protein
MTFALFVLLFAVTLGAAASVLGVSLDGAILAGGITGLGAMAVFALNEDGL